MKMWRQFVPPLQGGQNRPDASPGLRSLKRTSSGAIVEPSLRDEVRNATRFGEERNRSRHQGWFMRLPYPCLCPMNSALNQLPD
jgi:hypothetical protein